VAAYLDCETEGFTTVGDHDMFVGRVVAGDQLRDVPILTTAHFGDPYRTEAT
jgi:flavin reductase (DIM6/NTAB) family NADH-FMN oxidoreductase RutF